jgi:hypothetical protein
VLSPVAPRVPAAFSLAEGCIISLARAVLPGRAAMLDDVARLLGAYTWVDPPTRRLRS